MNALKEHGFDGVRVLFPRGIPGGQANPVPRGRGVPSTDIVPAALGVNDVGRDLGTNMPTATAAVAAPGQRPIGIEFSPPPGGTPDEIQGGTDESVGPHRVISLRDRDCLVDSVVPSTRRQDDFGRYL